MSVEEAAKMQIENLIFRLNDLAGKRKELHDQIWTLELEGEKLRIELIALITKEIK